MAIHDDSAGTLAELDLRMEPVIRERGGKPFPFPVLLDAERRTVEAYGVNEFPTVLLVDPTGKIVSVGSEGTLAEQLAALEKGILR